MEATRSCRPGPKDSEPTSFPKIYAPFLTEGRPLEDEIYSWRPDEIKKLAVLAGEDHVVVGEYTDDVAAVRREYFACLITMQANPRIYRFKVSITQPEIVGVRPEDYGRGVHRGSDLSNQIVCWGIGRILDDETEASDETYSLGVWDIEDEMLARRY